VLTGIEPVYRYKGIGFIVHDCGHRRVFQSERMNYIVCLLHANLLLGFSTVWWANTHNRHHGRLDPLDLDPDIDFSFWHFLSAKQTGREDPSASLQSIKRTFSLCWFRSDQTNIYLQSQNDSIRAPGFQLVPNKFSRVRDRTTSPESRLSIASLRSPFRKVASRFTRA
jgi:hypothetical protein